MKKQKEKEKEKKKQNNQITISRKYIHEIFHHYIKITTKLTN
jgi:hypothetical protein